MIDPDEQRANPAEQDGIIGITASSAALMVAHQEADFALTTDHLSGARVGICCICILVEPLICRLTAGIAAEPHSIINIVPL